MRGPHARVGWHTSFSSYHAINRLSEQSTSIETNELAATGFLRERKGKARKGKEKEKKREHSWRNKPAGKVSSGLTSILDSRMKRVTLEELAKHNKEGDLWLAVAGDVYDVSNFAVGHPGGTKLIEQYSGTQPPHCNKHAPSAV